jgi:hypothetical protein
MGAHQLERVPVQPLTRNHLMRLCNSRRVGSASEASACPPSSDDRFRTKWWACGRRAGLARPYKFQPTRRTGRSGLSTRKLWNTTGCHWRQLWAASADTSCDANQDTGGREPRQWHPIPPICDRQTTTNRAGAANYFCCRNPCESPVIVFVTSARVPTITNIRNLDWPAGRPLGSCVRNTQFHLTTFSAGKRKRP